MTILHLGVIDIPYANPPPAPKKVAQAKRGKANKPKKTVAVSVGVEMTGDVAEILETEYGLMQGFFDLHVPEIAASLEQGVAGAIETLMLGGPVIANPFAAATTEIEATFKQFLDRKGFDGLIRGVPTGASLAGVNHRLAHPYAAGNPPRPSFIDTGTYQASFKAWIDG